MPDEFVPDLAREIAHPPTSVPVLKCWKGHYDKVFVALHPFFRVPCVEELAGANSVLVDGKKYVEPDWSRLSLPDGRFFESVKEQSETVTWAAVHHAVCPDTPFKTFGLCTWISSCLGRRKDVPADLQDAIALWCNERALFLPLDDILCPTMEPSIGAFLLAAGIVEVEIYDAHHMNRKTFEADRFCRGFPSAGVWNGESSRAVSCIHAQVPGLVMSWTMDSVECLIGLTDSVLERARPENFFEGFYADTSTYSDWLNPFDFTERN